MKVFTLQNGKRLNEKEFCSYFEKKVFSTIRKHKLIGRKDKIKVQNKILLFILTKFCNLYNIQKPSLKPKTFTKLSISDNLDTGSEFVLSSLMKNNFSFNKIKPRSGKIIKPFFFCSEKEIQLYSKLKRIPYKSEKKSDISKWLDELEKRQKGIKNSIISSLIKIQKIKN
ncbi:MAG: hypothetical protein JSW08_01860 [archaeon]|nr:MAG: hypothetical protein JSW08_01860 [archaeon]